VASGDDDKHNPWIEFKPLFVSAQSFDHHDLTVREIRESQVTTV
jgi:hypothetical protein